MTKCPILLSLHRARLKRLVHTIEYLKHMTVDNGERYLNFTQNQINYLGCMKMVSVILYNELNIY